MELTINVGYEQIVSLLKQLPSEQIEKIKQELTQSYIPQKTQTDISEFQQFLLSGPVMSDEQYQNFKDNRKRFNAQI